MVVEMRQTRSHTHHAGVGVHKRDAGGAHGAAGLTHRLKAHLRVELVGGHHRTGGAPRDERFEFVAREHTAGVVFQKLAYRHAGGGLVDTGANHRAGHSVQLRAAVLLDAHRREPLPALLDDPGDRGDRLDVVHDRGRLEGTDNRREGRLHAGLAALAFERFDKPGLFTTDVGAGARVHVKIEVETLTHDVFAEVALGVGLFNGAFEPADRALQFAPHKDVAVADAQRPGRDDAALDMRMRIELHQVAILKRTRLALIGVDHQVLGQIALFGKKAPLDAAGEARAATTAQVGGLDLLNDRLPVHLEGFTHGLVATVGLVHIKRVPVGDVEITAEVLFLHHDVSSLDARMRP